MARPVAFVTGASSGIGLATATILASSGYDLALFDLNDEPLENLARTLRQQGGKVVPVYGDVASEVDMDRAITAIRSDFGRLDAVVANAGINGVWAPIDDLTPDEWDATIRVNLRGTYLTLNRTVPLMKDRGRGSIVVVASINGVRTFTNPGATAYSATKAAQVAMTQQLALELGRHGIRINVVCPGAIETNIEASTEIRHREEAEVPVIWPEGSVPITGGDPGRANDVGKIIMFLLSDAARHITGSPVFVDGGQGLLS
ncbi:MULTISPECIES: SDR family oxidoreductase [Rhizobium]|uniref:3-ketoacyl-(Acyl-carrier-protein) reductase n=1 Tax=Rhizobium favelukesii TaxID=348824 RepID=W6RIE7_9HYPH|nr:MULTISPECIES: SDR family NAD(P)-dependent oxidoreductase [Rhizobium]MCS0461014.1 SDR family oxidoreductase [Rhizobium favelukesii]UFS85633.1 SDR family oxidoreductase [Rhizobium sp. T136]CDM60962.1 3-ketoacyl-(acyl-carrier-protein) reductase [Rhizobium favelukesii]